MGPWSLLVDVDPSTHVHLHAMAWEPTGTCRDPAFLLVHGLASNAQLWAGVAEVLVAAGHRVVAVDQRGHGLSSKVDTGYDFATLTADLVAVIDALDLGTPVVAGQSWGGNVVIELAARHPDRTSGVACVDGGHFELAAEFPDRDAMLAALTPPRLVGMRWDDLDAGLRGRATAWPESGIRGQLANFVRRPDGTVAPHLTLERHLAILDELWDHRPSAAYDRVTTPVLLLPVHGGTRAQAKVAAVEHAHATLPRARLHWFRGDHDVHAEQPRAVAEQLLAGVADEFFDVHDP